MMCMLSFFFSLFEAKCILLKEYVCINNLHVYYLFLVFRLDKQYNAIWWIIFEVLQACSFLGIIKMSGPLNVRPHSSPSLN